MNRTIIYGSYATIYVFGGPDFIHVTGIMAYPDSVTGTVHKQPFSNLVIKSVKIVLFKVFWPVKNPGALKIKLKKKKHSFFYQ